MLSLCEIDDQIKELNQWYVKAFDLIMWFVDMDTKLSASCPGDASNFTVI